MFKNLIFMIFIFGKTKNDNYKNEEWKNIVLKHEKRSEKIPKIEKEWRNIIISYEKSAKMKNKTYKIEQEARKKRVKKIPHLFEEPFANRIDEKNMFSKRKHGDYLILE